MGMKIYAAALNEHEAFDDTFLPIIPFENWEAEKLAPDADAREKRGDDPYMPNPDYVANAGLSLSNANSKLLFEQIGFEFDEEDMVLPIGSVHRAAMLGLNGAAAQFTQADQVAVGAEGTAIYTCGVVDGYMTYRLSQLLAVVVEGRKRGATHIIAA
jgi:hypothetical protein